MGNKAGLSDLEHGMVVGARRSEDFKNWFTENGPKEKISSEWQLCGGKCLNVRRMCRLDRDDRKAAVTQITTRYNQGMQNTISEHTTLQTISTGFLNKTMSSLYSNGLHKHLRDVVEREIRTMDVQPTNLQQLLHYLQGANKFLSCTMGETVTNIHTRYTHGTEGGQILLESLQCRRRGVTH
uniref:Uncharacterized protein n=1 Tax=Leptobrachium leishanense TaxID=445787 RepID=A0A8C5QWN6_9ANUR